jgi:hypothetical protein
MSDKKDSFNVRIIPTWDIINKIEGEAAQLLQGYPDSIRDATLIVVNELVENAIKYGKQAKNCETIEFNMTVRENVIKILVANGVISDSHADNVITHIKRIQASDNPMDLYIARLHELLEKPASNTESQLGLYRIAYEGQFKLSYTYRDNIINVMAERAL